ncbi:hypothetical protein [Rhizobium rhizogenes]|nr:hypothetical protein [Rhizobium rhizogenes]
MRARFASTNHPRAAPVPKFRIFDYLRPHAVPFGQSLREEL